MSVSHFLYLRDGKFSNGCNRQTVTSFIDEALQSNSPDGLVLYFHGGLNDEASGLKSANTLLTLYTEQGRAWPIFHIWHSGLLDVLRAQLVKIGGESLFQEFVKKVTEWVLKKFPDIAGKGLGTEVDTQRLRAEFDAYFAQPLDGALPPPTAVRTAEASPVTKGAGPRLNEDLLATEIATSLEPQFKEAVTRVANDRNPPPAGGKGRDGGTTDTEHSLLSPQAAHELFGATYGAKGLIDWFAVAKFVARVVIAVVKRHFAGRDHGTYPTIVEEVLRAAYLANVGTDIWDAMKAFTADTFKPGAAEYGGTALLEELAARYAANQTFSKITLIGHSTGSNYICNLLAHAATTLPNVKFDIVFLAPVVTHDIVADTLQKFGKQIAGIRLFGMSDPLEAADRVAGIIYPRSLLYFVSGVLENDPMSDKPILGMERYLAMSTYQQGFASVDACKRYFYGASPARLIWADSNVGAGLNCTAHHHGDFDDGDPPCMESVVHILQSGF